MPHARTRPRRVPMEELRARLGHPDDVLKALKSGDRVDEHVHRFIAHSPYLSMATSDAAGRADCSPRGDHPGFVKVLDERTLAIPDRPGNKMADSFRNLAENDGIGLLFLVPGVAEVLRVNGSAYATDEPDVLARMRVNGKDAQFALIVEVEQVFFHCGRALLRSRLWDPDGQALAAEVPSPGEIAASQAGLDIDPAVLERELKAGYRKLY
ncbi:pyridoxamine 5'-phosphate oxidase family protein [Saccharopolyspora sp. NFXS83]|uniref:MSMEG_1061 family FMN-dependent PPOX-type flavoprotein n=1 Tax=Saccharopolyspora sp. NFXS83 TaxID=2993560 RepID=UPI00224B841E|nr:MSMEG_1061 family FMN-dependent PPOX-type flavoprotein [Saccharopolyspora sp. NFXS83]MCX2730166.1 pyridoxamine 5'-phosphate oxidase family protein [Saccharopolyspora sp. NFXS83]